MEGTSDPTRKYSITMPRDIAEAAPTRSGPSGLSACVTAAVALRGTRRCCRHLTGPRVGNRAVLSRPRGRRA
ncbi:hypothetical protein M2169_001941 [Streptomyces sp. MJP52]|nr:hypothetical protein [Streptomyces sp. MJP52]